jgi:aminodeoxyfutalosine deaminase
MFKRDLAPALGTDSLASCESVSIFDEMAFVRQHYPGVSPADVLAMATKNGAYALGLGLHYGTLDPGRQSTFIYLDPGPVTRADILEKVTTYETG